MPEQQEKKEKEEKKKEKEILEKLKAHQITMDKLEKTYGKESIMRMGEWVADNVPSFSSGSICLDGALGVCGFPR